MLWLARIGMLHVGVNLVHYEYLFAWRGPIARHDWVWISRLTQDGVRRKFLLLMKMLLYCWCLGFKKLCINMRVCDDARRNGRCWNLNGQKVGILYPALLNGRDFFTSCTKHLIFRHFYPNYSNLCDVNWTASSEFGTYRLCEQRRFRRACASAQSRQNLRCPLIQAVSQEEPSDKARSLTPLNGWACAVKICHDGMLEDTNSLDGAHLTIW